MCDTIEKLYYGNIEPCAKTYDYTGKYGRAVKKADKAKESLAAKLSEKDAELLEEVINLFDDVTNLYALDAFVDGFRLGGRMQLEILCRDNDGGLRDITE
ncbi:MAG: hypothetical protein VB092_08095 [Oscillospiraceae bacterium]|nr:hypothetical protein [Oscillospiraceae bacterium]